MKKFKRLLAFAMAMIMCLGIAVTASAEEGGKITVKSAVDGAQYSVYKIFSATTSGVNMSYTVEGKAKEFMSQQVDEKGEIKSDNDVVFTLVDNGDSTYVTVGDNPQKAAEWVQNHISNLRPENAEKSQIASNNTVVFEDLAPGYYYVLSNQATEDGGAAVMLANLNTEVEINEKHGTPGFGPEDPTDPEPVGKHADKETVEIGEIITYTIRYKNALNYVDGALVTEYTVNDEFPAGLELEKDSVTVTVNDVPVTFTNSRTDGKGISGTIAWASRTTNADGTFTDILTYDAPAVIVITYTVKVTNEIATGNTGATNTVTIGYRTTNSDKDGEDTDEETVYSAEIEINKYAENDENTKLVADFVIQKVSGITPDDSADNGKYLKINETTGEISWVDEVAEATTLTTDQGKTIPADEEAGTEEIKFTEGFKTVKGLKAGTYSLIETKAPNGYTLLAEGKSFTINPQITDEGENVTVEGMATTLNVANKLGNLLPSTGGIGTTIFYVVGGLLVAGAGILLITKKRMSKEQ